jgi:hypothetical protein
MANETRRGANAPVQWDKLCAASDVFWHFRNGLSEVLVRAREVGTEVEVCTQTVIDDDVKTVGRARFSSPQDLLPHLLATKQGFQLNGWVLIPGGQKRFGF